MEHSAKRLLMHAAGRMAILMVLLATPGRCMAASVFEPIAGWDRHLFPSYIIATATMRATPEEKKAAAQELVLGDVHGSLGVTIQSPADNASAKVTIASDSILDSSVFVATLPKKGVRYKVYPPIKYKYNALVRNMQTIPVTVTYRVEMPGAAAEEQTVTATLRSINDCPMSYEDDKKNTVEVNFIFAAYVNEDHPQIQEILREALDTGIVDAFEGYGDDADPEDVLRQAYALWHVLSKRGVHYSNVTTTAGDSDRVDAQHVRLINDSIHSAQANCVDGSVLFASLLRKIGIEPFLAVEPEHIYVGFYLDEDEKQRVGLETTLLGSKPEQGDDRELKGFGKIVDSKWVNTDSWAAFVTAVRDGSENLQRDRKKFESDKEAEYEIVSIARARELGILPIPFTPAGKE
jgi:hypothetical protein